MSKKTFAVWAVILATFTAIAIALIIKNEKKDTDPTSQTSKSSVTGRTRSSKSAETKEDETEESEEHTESEEPYESETEIYTESPIPFESEEVVVTGNEILHIYSDEDFVPENGIKGTAEIIFYDDYTCRFIGVISDALEYEYVSRWSNDDGLGFANIKNVAAECKNSAERINAKALGFEYGYKLNLFHQVVNENGTVRILTSGSNYELTSPILETSFTLKKYELNNLGIEVEKLATETAPAPTYIAPTKQTEKETKKEPTEEPTEKQSETEVPSESESGTETLVLSYYTTNPDETGVIAFYADHTVRIMGTVGGAYDYSYYSTWSIRSNTLYIEDKTGIKVECTNESYIKDLEAAGLNASYQVDAQHTFVADGSTYTVTVEGSTDTLAIFQPMFTLTASDVKKLGISTGSTEKTNAPTVAPTEKPTVAPTQKPTVAPTEKPTVAPTQAPTEAPTQAPTEAPTVSPTSGTEKKLLLTLSYKSSSNEDDFPSSSVLKFYSDGTVENSGSIITLWDYSYQTTWEVKNGSLVIKDKTRITAECTNEDKLILLEMIKSYGLDVENKYILNFKHTITKKTSGYKILVQYFVDGATDNEPLEEATFTLSTTDAKKLGLK